MSRISLRSPWSSLPQGWRWALWTLAVGAGFLVYANLPRNRYRVQMGCRAGLRQIHAALHAYGRANGCWPGSLPALSIRRRVPFVLNPRAAGSAYPGPEGAPLAWESEAWDHGDGTWGPVPWQKSRCVLFADGSVRSLSEDGMRLLEAP